jgi:hypothetical protein
MKVSEVPVESWHIDDFVDDKIRDALGNRAPVQRIPNRNAASGMEKKPEPTKPILWNIFISIGVGREGHIGMLVGTVEAADDNEAIEKAPAWTKKYERKLIAVPAVSDASRARRNPP